MAITDTTERVAPLLDIVRHGPLDYSPAINPRSGTEEAFWAAIADKPLDAAPRLVYADWLQERQEDSELAVILRKWRGGWLPITARGADTALITDLCFLGGHNQTTWIGELTGYFKAIRQGLFRVMPIQRLIVTDLVQRCVRYRDGGYLINIQEFDADLWRAIVEDCDLTYDRWRTREVVFSTFERMADVFSNSFLRFARYASGLADLGPKFISKAGVMAARWQNPTTHFIRENGMEIRRLEDYLVHGLHVLEPSFRRRLKYSR